jgi:hypothetical protein
MTGVHDAVGATISAKQAAMAVIEKQPEQALLDDIVVAVAA